MDNIFDPSSIIEIGMYSILYASAPECDKNGDVYDVKVIQELNGASVNYLYHHLKSKINWIKLRESISSIDFLMTSDSNKLSDIFITTPYGLIKKNRTGIGATTLELNSPRNSIVVVPTRALAYEKAKNSYNTNTQKYSILYYGSSISGFNQQNISDYLNDTNIEYKKFIVVADSLPKLMSNIGDNSYKDYFIMVDEIDSYQYDTSYRPALEDVIDYYLKFPYTKRCLVSATIGSFSNPLINDEPIINVCFNTIESRNIELIHTNNTIETARKKIEEIIEEHPDDKILIAFNAVKGGIIPIIKSINEDLRQDCAVLCGIKSKPYVEEYYTEIIEQQLPKRINFMTCTYFVGIDIRHRFHLISIADANIIHSLLSVDKFQQISGRCRDAEGLLSETIIYSTSTQRNSIPENISIVKEHIMRDAIEVRNYANHMHYLHNNFPQLRIEALSSEEIINYTKKDYYGSAHLPLVRDCKVNGNIEVSYFNIDGILIQLHLKAVTYNGDRTLKDELEKQGHHVDFSQVIEEISRTEAIIDETNNEVRQTQAEECDSLVEALRERDSIQDQKELAHTLKARELTQYSSKFLDNFIELIDYIPFEKLIEKLSEINLFNEKKYSIFYNKIVFWALDEQHPLKVNIKEAFPIGSTMTGELISERFNNIWMGVLGGNQLSQRAVYYKLELFVKKGERTQNDQRQNVYPILSYDVLDLQCDPSSRIAADTNVSRMFRSLDN